MKQSIITKLEKLADRYEELAALLSAPEIISDQNKFRDCSVEYSELEPVVKTFNTYCQAKEELEEVDAMSADTDPDIREMAKEEYPVIKTRIAELQERLQILLLPKDPNDSHNVFLEIRAGTGGNEAALFAGDLYRMYARYAEIQGWRVEIISTSEGEQGGYKELISRIVGTDVYSHLKFESGAHRVQRVPETESQGRIHTSACTVAIMPEIDTSTEIEVNKADLRIDTFRSSGAGGQHVNKTDSAIRITHIPTGIVVECQQERSQHKNRAKAMSLLASRLQAEEQERLDSERANARKSLVGSGDRSERIRTYNYPQGRVTDHRINLTLYKLQEIITGDLQQVIEPLMNEYQAELLSSVSSDT